MKYTFQHFIDLKTSADSMQIIQIDAGGDYLMQRTRHLWPAFKYMKMGAVSIKLLPASTLPVDPLGLGYGDTDPQTVDPRDQMNPGLVRITNGEDIFTNVAGLSEGEQRIMYQNMMLDQRWSKFMLQSGFKRFAKPLYWQVGQLHQDAFPGAIVNIPKMNNGSFVGTDTFGAAFASNQTDAQNADSPKGTLDAYHSDPRGFFQVGHRGRMGWIPTDALMKVANRSNTASGNGFVDTPSPNVMPCINCITVVLPKMHKTNYYYRMFITETVYFAGLKNVGINGEENLGEGAGIDNFVRAGVPIAALPNKWFSQGDKFYTDLASGVPINMKDVYKLNDGSDE